MSTMSSPCRGLFTVYRATTSTLANIGIPNSLIGLYTSHHLLRLYVFPNICVLSSNSDGEATGFGGFFFFLSWKDAGCGEHTWNRPSCKQGHAWFPVQPATIVFWDNFANTIFEQPHSRLMTGRVWNCVHWETGLQYVCTWWEFHILFVRIDTFFSFSFFPLVFAILAKRCKHLPVLPLIFNSCFVSRFVGMVQK